VNEVKPLRVVFDSLSEMRLLAQNSLRYRRQILALKHFFVGRRCTVLLLDDLSSQAGDLHLHSIAHGVITLQQLALDYGSERRRLRIKKMRGPHHVGDRDPPSRPEELHRLNEADFGRMKKRATSPTCGGASSSRLASATLIRGGNCLAHSCQRAAGLAGPCPSPVSLSRERIRNIHRTSQSLIDERTWADVRQPTDV
jgi:KaiC